MTPTPSLDPPVCPECNSAISDELQRNLQTSSEIVCETCGRAINIKDITLVRVKTPDKSIKKRQKSRKSQSSKNDSEAQWAENLEKLGKSWETFVKKFTKFWNSFLKALTRFWDRMKGSYQKYSAGSTITPVPKASQENLSPSQSYLAPKFDPNTGLPISQPDTLDKKPKAKFDPETGKKIVYEKAPTIQKLVIEPSIPTVHKEEKTPIIESDEIASEEGPKKDIFTVLERDVRARLLNLSIESEDRNIIGRSFIYLSVEQQRQYLTELERVNEPSGKGIENLIKIIQKLPIPGHQQDFLVDQLNYIPEIDHQEFASALEPDLETISEKNESVSPQIRKKSPAPELEITKSPKKKKSSKQIKKKRLLSD